MGRYKGSVRQKSERPWGSVWVQGEVRCMKNVALARAIDAENYPTNEKSNLNTKQCMTDQQF